MAHLPPAPPAQPIHLRDVLPAQEDHEGSLRVRSGPEVRRRKPDREVEEERIREAVLPQVHSTEGYKLRNDLHLPRAELASRGRQGRRMCPLRLPWLLERIRLTRFAHLSLSNASIVIVTIHCTYTIVSAIVRTHVALAAKLRRLGSCMTMGVGTRTMMRAAWMLPALCTS